MSNTPTYVWILHFNKGHQFCSSICLFLCQHHTVLITMFMIILDIGQSKSYHFTFTQDCLDPLRFYKILSQLMQFHKEALLELLRCNDKSENCHLYKIESSNLKTWYSFLLFWSFSVLLIVLIFCAKILHVFCQTSSQRFHAC